MRIVAIAIASGCLQFMLNEFCNFFDIPFSFKKERKIIVNSNWECSRCGHVNGDWSSICGKCGRSSSGYNDMGTETGMYSTTP